MLILMKSLGIHMNVCNAYCQPFASYIIAEHIPQYLWSPQTLTCHGHSFKLCEGLAGKIESTLLYVAV